MRPASTSRLQRKRAHDDPRDAALFVLVAPGHPVDRVAAEIGDHLAHLARLRHRSVALLAQILALDVHHLGKVARLGGTAHRLERLARILFGLVEQLHAEVADMPGDPLARGAHLLAGFAYRSDEHTSELQSLMRISYAVF